MSDANTKQQHCTADPRGGVPAGCAAVIETAAGMMMFGDPEIGRKMLEDLLQMAKASGCASRPNCSTVIDTVTELLRHGDEQSGVETRRA